VRLTVNQATGERIVATADADRDGTFEAPIDTAGLEVGRHRLRARCGSLLESDLDVVLASGVGGSGGSLAVAWIVALGALVVLQAHPWRRL
jgi:hypothetical protein